MERLMYDIYIANNITGVMRNHGEWFFQKFHSGVELKSLCEDHGLSPVNVSKKGGLVYFGSKLIAHCKKVNNLPVDVVKESIFNEFNMFYSQTERYDNADKVWDILSGYYCES